jgi:hypothetical protein
MSVDNKIRVMLLMLNHGYWTRRIRTIKDLPTFVVDIIMLWDRSSQLHSIESLRKFIEDSQVTRVVSLFQLESGSNRQDA